MSGHTPAPQGAPGLEVVRADGEHALPEPFENPGLPAHRPRLGPDDRRGMVLRTRAVHRPRPSGGVAAH